MGLTMTKAEQLAYSLIKSNIPGILIVENKKPLETELAFRLQGERKTIVNLLANSMARYPALKEVILESIAALDKGPIAKNNNKLNDMAKTAADKKKTVLVKQIGDKMKQWADSAFLTSISVLDEFVQIEPLFDDLKARNPQSNHSPKAFRSGLKLWCEYYNYTYNPTEYRSEKNGRVYKELPVEELKGGFIVKLKGDDRQPIIKLRECVYIRTKV
jgi:hypothetical protein